MNLTKPKNIDLEMATLQDICGELQDRELGYVLLVQEPNGLFLSHQPNVKPATVMIALNDLPTAAFLIRTYLQYAGTELND